MWSKRLGEEERDPFSTSVFEHLHPMMQEDCLVPGLWVAPTCFCLHCFEYIPSLANDIVIIYPLSSCPLCGPVWREGHFYPQQMISKQLYLDSDILGETYAGQWERWEERWKLRIPRTFWKQSLNIRDIHRGQSLSITEEVSEVKRNEVTKPELELGFLPPRAMWSQNYLPLSPSVNHEQHIRKYLWFGATRRVKPLSS